MFVINIKSFKKLKYTFLKNVLSIFEKASLSIVYRKCGHEYKKRFKEEEDLIEILKIIGLINNIKEYHESKKKHKNVGSLELYWSLTYFNFLISWFWFFNLIIVCASISVFVSLVSIPVRITSSAIVLKICVITAEIKKYKSINET